MGTEESDFIIIKKGGTWNEMKRKIVSIFCVLCILSLFVESIYALDYKTVFIKD